MRNGLWEFLCIKVETLEEHFEIMNLEVDIPEDYVGLLTGMDFAKCPTADSLTNVHNVERNIQCSSASQANFYLGKFLLQVFPPQFPETH
jgi:hypothetical protein